MIFAACTLAFFVALVRGVADSGAAVLGKVPNQRFVDQRGRPRSTHDLLGRIWIANFIYTRCEAVCSANTARLARFSRRLGTLGGQLHYVSISVDPSYDRPDVLRSYGERFDAAAEDWSFFTAPDSAGYGNDRQFSSWGLPGDNENAASVAHSERWLLIDAQGRVRARVASDAAGQDSLAHAALDLSATLKR